MTPKKFSDLSPERRKNELVNHFCREAHDLVRGRGNITREDLEYCVSKISMLKDERLKECFAELIAWGDDERSRLETILALASESLTLISITQLRKISINSALKCELKRLAQESEQGKVLYCE